MDTMLTIKIPKTLSRVADSIEHDIRSRGLMPGDRYLATRDVAELLGISQATCHRALQLLAKREVLTRHRKSGTFIGPKVSPAPEKSLVRSVYVLLSPDRSWGALTRGEVMDGLWRALPEVGLHFVVLPKNNEKRYTEDLLNGAATLGQLFGVVAVSCPRSVYNYLAGVAAPVVVIGSVDSEEGTLPSVDADQRQAGRLLAECVLKRGCHQVIAFMPELWRPGDNLFMEGLADSLGKGGISAGSLRVWSLPAVAQIVQDRVVNLLADVEERLELVCHDYTIVTWIDALRESRPDLHWEKIGIAFQDETRTRDRHSPHPFTYTSVPVIDQSVLVGQMVARLGAGDELPQRHVLLPMGLFDPATAENVHGQNRAIVS
jgi:DNA-binding LacI/PurR family transcriptional regulator